MLYHPKDFLNLSLQVEKEDGRLLQDACKGKPVRYKIDGKWKRTWTCHCSESARMEIPYNPTLKVRLYDDEDTDVLVVDHPGEPPKGTDVPRVTVCAVDDAVGLWPRFKGTISNKSHQP